MFLPLLGGLTSPATLPQDDNPSQAEARRWRTLEATGETTPALRYLVITPDDFDPQRPVPCLFALPPGRQDEDMVTVGLDLYFEQEAKRRGWLVVSPAAPTGSSFVSGAEDRIPALLDAIKAEFLVEGGRFHLAGVSNGGRAALRIAGLWPERFHSVTVLPGAPSSRADEERLAGIAHLPLSFHVGSEDTDWRAAAQKTIEQLEALGADDILFEEHPGEGHVLDKALAPALFERWEALRKSAAVRATKEAAAASVLDSLHAASKAGDANGYLSQFAPGAVFIGTAPGERWSLAALRSYVQQRFAAGDAWTYSVQERHVTLGPGGRSAWFEEVLKNDRYGATRGSGVLVKTGERWRIARYVLSLAVPDEAAPDVVERIRKAR